MKLTSNGETLAESKVLIMYILNCIKKPISNNNLYKIVLSVLDMNYFYFQQFLLDLVKSEFVLSYSQDEQQLYLITDKGIKTLELTEDIIPGILKLQVDTNLKYTLDDVNEENSIVAEYTPINENYYNVTCKIMENNECLFEVKTFAGSREQSKHIVDNWKNHANTMYPELLGILTKTFKDEPLDNTNKKHNSKVPDSPRNVYNYDIINRSIDEASNSQNYDEKNITPKLSTDSSNDRNNSYIIEGNLNLFDMINPEN